MTFDGFFPQFSENQIFVIGGTYNSEHNIKRIYDTQSGFARNQGPSLNMGSMRDGEKTLIIVAGGLQSNQLLNSVEIYDPTDNTWHRGKNKFPSTRN